jgi:hypothetical protein
MEVLQNQVEGLLSGSARRQIPDKEGVPLASKEVAFPEGIVQMLNFLLKDIAYP